MNGAAHSLFVQFRETTCCHKDCGMSFAMPDTFYQRMKETKVSFYCPRGHSQYFVGETEEEKLRKRLQWAEEREKSLRLQQEREREEHRRSLQRQERKTRAAKAVLTKTRKRIQNGVCPCCNRTFQNLMAHMKTKHPNYHKKKGA